VAAHALVAARAERLAAFARQHDRADLRVLARVLQRARDLHDRARAKGVSDLRSGDRDLCDPLRRGGRLLVADVRVSAVAAVRSRYPSGAHGAKASLWAMVVEGWLARAAAQRPERTALDTAGGSCSYEQLLSLARAGAEDLAGRGVQRGQRVAIA